MDEIREGWSEKEVACTRKRRGERADMKKKSKPLKSKRDPPREPYPIIFVGREF